MFDCVFVSDFAIGETHDLIQRAAYQKRVLDVLLQAKSALKNLPPDATDDDVKKAFVNLRGPLMELNKCPDLVVNRGHYFGTSYFAEEPPLSDEDKRALIEYLKTF